MDSNIAELREKTVEELDILITDIKEELLRLRQQKNTQTLKPGEINVVRKSLARVMTARTEKIYAEEFEKHRNDKRLPKDLRRRTTKAMRLALTPKQLKKAVHSVHKRRRAYPAQFFSYAE